MTGNSIADMKKFSIKELESLSGIKAHTIRCWEERYSILKPERNSANTRRYSIDELQKLLPLSLLNKNGYKISHLSYLSLEELSFKVAALPCNEDRQQRAINELVIAMYQLNIEGFEAILVNCYLMWPVDVVVHSIIYPFLKKVCLLSQGKLLNEEHFVVTNIRTKLCASIERIETKKNNGKSILLFLPDERQLDLLLLYFHCLLKLEGWKVFYMGINVSLKNLQELFINIKPDYILSYFPKKHSFSFNDCSATMKTLLPNSKFLVINTDTSCSLQGSFEHIINVNSDDVYSYLSLSDY